MPQEPTPPRVDPPREPEPREPEPKKKPGLISLIEAMPPGKRIESFSEAVVSCIHREGHRFGPWQLMLRPDSLRETFGEVWARTCTRYLQTAHGPINCMGGEEAVLMPASLECDRELVRKELEKAGEKLIVGAPPFPKLESDLPVAESGSTIEVPTPGSVRGAQEARAGGVGDRLHRAELFRGLLGIAFGKAQVRSVGAVQMNPSEEGPRRQSNPFLTGWEPEPWQEKAIREALESPEGKAMLQRMADDIDGWIIDDIKKLLPPQGPENNHGSISSFRPES